MNFPVVCRNHNRAVVDLCYGPMTPNGVFLLTASEDHTAILQKGETGEIIHKFIGHEGPVWSCDMNSDATIVATASEDCTVKIWDINTRQCAHTFSERNIMQSCAFSEASNLILMGGFGDNLKIHDLNRPDAPTLEFPTIDGFIRSVAWIDSSRIMASFSNETGFRLWDIRDFKWFARYNTPSSVTSIEVSQDKTCVTTVDGSIATIWNAGFNSSRRLDLPCLSESGSLRLQNDILITGGDDRLIHIWNIIDDAEIGTTHGDHMGSIHCVRFSPSGESYAAGSQDGRTIIRRLNVDKGEEEMC